ncbi:MAG: hypothetical protein O6952_01235 [Planctomycetota bacterium]|nr:hypothetical protein [Planctomycetota bacterium]
MRWIARPVTGAAVLGTILIVSLAVYSARAYREVSESPEFTVSRIEVDLVEGSGALREPMRRDLHGLLQAVRGESLFDPILITRVGRRLSSLPWVEAVAEVSRSYPDRIRAQLRVRRPVVALERSNGAPVILDAEGRTLPRAYFTDSEVPRVRGLAGGNHSRREVEEVILVVAELEAAGVFDLCDLEAVDLSNLWGDRRPGESEIVLSLPNGAEIEWGRPEARALDEPTPEMKMDGLKEALRWYPGLSGVRRVRLQYREQTVEPIRVARGDGTADGPSR